jgi:hypothetical protein
MIILHAETMAGLAAERKFNARGALRRICAFQWLHAGTRSYPGLVHATAAS